MLGDTNLEKRHCLNTPGSCQSWLWVMWYRSRTKQVQNQTGPKANKWMLYGVVVETLDNNQYRVKMDGSCRVSLRNGQFLKRIHPVSSRLSPHGSSSSTNSGGQVPNCELEMDDAEGPRLRRSARLQHRGDH